MAKPSITSILRKNALYLILASLFLLAGLLSVFNIEKGDWVLYLSHHRTAIGDFFFAWGTRLGEPLTYLIAIILLLTYRKRHAIGLPLLGIVVMIVTYFSKKYFAQPRPMLYFSQLGTFDQIQLVEGIRVNGGANSFPSGHTMSAFALFTFLALCVANKRWAALGLLAAAITVGISRIYLVQHFLEDIVLGGAMGIVLAVCWYWFHMQWGKDYPHAWLDEPVGWGKGERA